MKKLRHRLLSAVIAGIMAFAAVPDAPLPLTVSASAASRLAAPKNFKVSAKSSTAIKLKWSKVSGADAYRVFKYDSSENEYVKYKDVTAASCTVSGLMPGTKYAFKVAALVKNNNKYTVQTKTSKLTASTKSGSLPAPDNITYTKTSNSISLKWDKVTNANGYIIQFYNWDTGKYEQCSDLILSNKHTLEGLISGTTYKIRVASALKKSSTTPKKVSDLIAQKYSSPMTITTYGSTEASEFFRNDFGLASGNVLLMSGIAKFTATDAVKNNKAYVDYIGEVLLNGKLSDITLSFNKQDLYYAFVIQSPVDYAAYPSWLGKFMDLYGSNYVIDRDFYGNISYNWTLDSGAVISCSYDQETHTAIYSGHADRYS